MSIRCHTQVQELTTVLLSNAQNKRCLVKAVWRGVSRIIHCSSAQSGSALVERAVCRARPSGRANILSDIRFWNPLPTGGELGEHFDLGGLKK